MSESIPVPNSIVLFEDRVVSRASNGAATDGHLMHDLVKALQYYQHAGRPLFHFWHPDPATVANNSTHSYVFPRFNFIDSGGRNFHQRVGVVPFEGTGTTTQSIVLTVDGSNTHTTPYPPTSSDISYPESTDVVDMDEVTQSSISGIIEEIRFGPSGSTSPYMFSGGVYEDWVDLADPTLVVTDENFFSGRDILAVKTSSTSVLDSFSSKQRSVWRLRRPVLAWSEQSPGVSTNYVEFGTSKNAYRYIFDQSIGDGGTAPSASGPGMSYPLMYSASGRRTQIRVYVFVLAGMETLVEGTTGTGTLAVANKNSGGTMGSMTALTNNIAITNAGTFQWYPTLATWNPSTAPFFLAYAGTSPDRIVLGAKGSADAKVRIAALAMLPFHRID